MLDSNHTEALSTGKMRDSLFDILDRYSNTIFNNGLIADDTYRMSAAIHELFKVEKVYSSMVPESLGGEGCSIEQMCEFLSALATIHPSSALTLAMHQHIVAANCFNFKNAKPGQALLEKVRDKELTLVSTGAGDWLASSGKLTKVDNGYLLNATKYFSSGSQLGDVLVTSAPYEDPLDGWQVFHFPVPLKNEKVTVLDDWKPMGMRGTGSNSVKLDDVFIPEDTIAVKRPRGDFHGMWTVVLPVALTIIMSVYRGVARQLVYKVKERVAGNNDPVLPYTLGELENSLTTAELAIADMVKTVKGLDFKPSTELVNIIVQRKTIATQAILSVAQKSLEACGGPAYLEQFGIEKLYRDALAVQYHPLQTKRQLLFTGSLALGKEPPSQSFQ